jgi:gamma-glutamylcyclotransferase
MLTFAYGSNMNWDQMRERCPSSRFVGIAVLSDHRLAFTRKSIKRGCGVADVVAEDGARVWGVVYEIADLDVGTLDASEGFRPGREKNSYCRRECMVFLDGQDQRPLTVSAYFGVSQPDPPRPNAAYKNLILSGGRGWHLPGAYILELEQIEVDG